MSEFSSFSSSPPSITNSFETESVSSDFDDFNCVGDDFLQNDYHMVSFDNKKIRKYMHPLPFCIFDFKKRQKCKKSKHAKKAKM